MHGFVILHALTTTIPKRLIPAPEALKLKAKEDAKNFKEGGASSAPASMSRNEASLKLQQYMGEASCFGNRTVRPTEPYKP